MNYLDNMLLHELYHELDKLEMQRKDLRQFRQCPEGKSLEQALQEIEEEESSIRERIEELEIIQSDYNNEEF